MDAYEAGLAALVDKHNREQLELELTQLHDYAQLARRTNPDRVGYWQRCIERRVRSFRQAAAAGVS